MGRRGPQAKTLRAWLKGLDAPTHIDVENAEEETVRVKVARDKTGQGRWTDTMSTIDALGPVKLRAFNADSEAIGVWTVPQRGDPAPLGHEADSDDDAATRSLKVFAHLLADAHRSSMAALERVVSVQSQHFAEERRAFSNTLVSMERMVSKASRQANRLRGLGEGDDEPSAPEPDALGDMIKEVVVPMVKSLMSKELGTNGSGTPGAS